jgi:hypothetical protein
MAIPNCIIATKIIALCVVEHSLVVNTCASPVRRNLHKRHTHSSAHSLCCARRGSEAGASLVHGVGPGW